MGPISHSDDCEIFVSMCLLRHYRNTVASTIQQELLYVGDESGKLLAIRDIIRKVQFSLW